ncbi:hypothetical protein FSP39_014039 [Pinctada imbricata]|uniref:Mab-21-like nucleotidyltransferase domain-containing protein n=1 Tax=Pinctada imbricata TaxID=66713 RepID=A0AA89C4K0_PINIB|nr:hypothetical protein FSP39_014039 [Pinctada imbricata]
MKQDGTFAKKQFVKEAAVTFLHVKDVLVSFPTGIEAEKCNYVISTESVHPGYCRLKTLQNGNNEAHGNLHVDKGGISYLSSSMARKQFRSKLSRNKKAIDSMLNTLLNKGEGAGFDMKFTDIFKGVPDDSLDLRRPFTSMGLRGILVSARQEKLKIQQENKEIGLIEEVEPSEVAHELAFTCKEWPLAAEEYKSRKRPFGWPSDGTVDKVISCGCHIVPTSHSKSSQSDIEWKLSFDAAQKQLVIEELSDSQRQYVQSSQLERRLTTIRRRPLEELFSLTESFTIVDIFPYNMDVKKVFAPVLADAKTYKNPTQAPASVEIFMSVSNALCNGFYHEYGFDNCAALFDDVIDNFVEPVLGHERADEQRDFVPHLLNQRNIEFSNDLPPEEIWKPITFCRFLITRYVEGNNGAGLYEHLACMYHAAAFIFRQHKKDLMANAREMFAQALQREGEGHGAGLFVDYGHFLCACEEYPDAIITLLKP